MVKIGVIGLIISMAIVCVRNATAAEKAIITAEHLAESAIDARSFVLPWLQPDQSSSKVQPLIGLAFAQTKIEHTSISGTLITLGATHRAYSKWTLGWFVFTDQFDVSGTSGISQLTSTALQDVPLELPARTEFTGSSGVFRQSGVGFTFLRELYHAKSKQIQLYGLVGLQFSRLDLKNYRAQYRVLEGESEGTKGNIGFSGSFDFVSPSLGVHCDIRYGSRLLVQSRLIAGLPIKDADFGRQIDGPEFNINTETSGAVPSKIGDGYVTAGINLHDVKTGFSIDVGSIVMFDKIERFTHRGLDQSLLISISWRG